MIDAALAALLLGLAIRGWFRGLVSQLLGIAVLVVGVALAFRTSSVTGAFVSNLTGWSPAWGRLAGGVATLFLLSLIAAIVGRTVHRTIRALPGVSALNRLGGAAVGVAAGVLVIVVVVSLASIVGLPAAAADEMEQSTAVSLITQPAGPIQGVIRGVGGSSQISELLALRSMVGSVTAVPGSQQVALVPVDDTELAVDDASAETLFDRLNRARASARVDPVTWSVGLSVLAQQMALEMYRTGALESETSVETRLGQAGLPFVVAQHHVALAVTPADLDFALVGQDDVLMERLDEQYRRVGIGVVDGPYGLLMVEIFTG